ncbi:hypothetical protein D3C84_555420 [compost metagenome]
MSTSLKLLIIFILSVTSTGCTINSEIRELKSKIDNERATIDSLSRQLKNETPITLATSHDLHGRLKYLIPAKWLKETSTPQLKISIIGYSADGLIKYKRRVGKAWIEPADDTQGQIYLRNILLDGKTGEINLSLNISADARSRIYAEIFGRRFNIQCKLKLDPTTITATFRPLAMQETELPFSISLSAPDDVKAKGECMLGALGDIGFELPLGDVTASAIPGKIELGFKSSGVINLPNTIGKDVSYHLKVTDPAVEAAVNSIDFRANLSISGE